MRRFIIVCVVAVTSISAFIPLGTTDASADQPRITAVAANSLLAASSDQTFLTAVEKNPSAFAGLAAARRGLIKRSDFTVQPRQSNTSVIASLQGVISVLKAHRATLQRADALRHPTVAQIKEFDRFRATSLGKDAKIEFAKHGTTVRFLQMHPDTSNTRAPEVVMGPQSSTQKALGFLQQERQLFGIDNAVHEFREKREIHDRLGFHHVVLQQLYRGVPVFDRELIVHLNKSGNPYAVNGDYIPRPANLDVTPEITADQAQAIVSQDMGNQSLTHLQNRLRIYVRKGGEPELAYILDFVNRDLHGWRYVVDAKSGHIIDKRMTDESASVSASGTDLNGNAVAFHAWSASGLYYMDDTTTPSPGTSGDPLGGNPPGAGMTQILSANGGGDINGGTAMPALYYVDSSSANSGWDPTAVSVIENIEDVYTYYQNNFSRNGIDGSGSNLQGIIHIGQVSNETSDNAYWSYSYASMFFGDGGTLLNAPAACLDIVAHEMTHGVDAATANLEYQDQSGALNESFSDVFGVLIANTDWVVGAGCMADGAPYLRSLSNPHSSDMGGQPAVFSEYVNTTQDDGGVHTNSGIPNYAAYLTSDGLTTLGTGTSIGRAETAKIYYRALTTYLTPTATFLDARNALVQAATDLYGSSSKEVAAVNKAWDTVGVVDSTSASPSSTTPTDTSAPNGSDLMVYLAPTATAGEFNICEQTIASPFGGYNVADVNCGLNGTAYAAEMRPVAINDGTGEYILFVGTDSNVYQIDPTNAVTQLTTTGNIESIAVPQDLAKIAVITNDKYENEIAVIDTSTNAIQYYPIAAPVYDGASKESVEQVITSSFDYSDNYLVFDALNCLSLQSSACPTGGFQYYSIGELSLVDGSVSFPFGNENYAYDLILPRFAYNNSYIVTFDLLDWSNYDTAGKVEGESLIANMATPGGTEVTGGGDRGAFLPTDIARIGAPSFSADDKYLTMELVDTGTGNLAAYRYPVTAAWDLDLTSGVGLNPGQLEFPLMTNTGQHVFTGAIQADKQNLAFGNVEVGQTDSINVTLTNTANRDVNLTGVTMTGSDYSTNLSPVLLPQGATITLAVNLTPTGSGGSRPGQLQIATDGSPSTLTVSMTGNAFLPPTATDEQISVSENSSGSGTLSGKSPSGNALVFSIVNKPSHGSVTITNTATGAFTYTPTTNYAGADSFTYEVNDGLADSNVATVSVTVKAVSSGGSSGGGGGGSQGVMTCLLLGLLIVRRRSRT